MNKKPDLKKIVRLAGNLVMLAALAFLIKKFMGMGLHPEDLRSPGVIGAFLLSLAVQTALICAACFPWLVFTQSLSGVKIPYRSAMPVYTRSNIYKYLPGNVFQYVGRNQLAADMQMSHVDVACATIFDVLFCVFWTGVISVCLLGQKLTELAAQYMGRFLVPGGIGIGILVLAVIFIRLKFRDKISSYLSRYLKAFAPGNRLKLCEGIVYYFVHNSISALMYFLCLKLMFPADTPTGTLVMLTGAFLFAWIIGFVTPGAPGGIGIRESVMMLVSGAEFEENVLLFVLVMRAASVLADVLAFVIGALYLRTQRRST